MNMAPFIALVIMQAKDAGGVQAGQDKYKAYFVNTRLYLRFKPDVDTILQTDGYGDCIVTE